MPAANISKFINLKDKNGVCIGEWAKQIEPGVVLCNVCIPKCQVKFVSGKKGLTNHSESAKHVKFSSDTVKLCSKLSKNISYGPDCPHRLL